MSVLSTSFLILYVYKELNKLLTEATAKLRAQGLKKGGSARKKFPDLSGDGKVTMKDVLMGRGVIKKKKPKKKGKKKWTLKKQK